MAEVIDGRHLNPDAAHLGLFLMRADGSVSRAQRMAEAAFGPNDPTTVLLQKAAIAPASASEGTWGAALAATNFAVDLSRERIDAISAFGALAAAGLVPFNTAATLSSAGVAGGWFGENKPIAVAAVNVATAKVDLLSVGAIVVMSMELARSPKALPFLRRSMERVAARIVDESLLDPTNAGVVGVKPASITFGAPTVAATADPGADLRAMLAAFGGNLETSVFVVNPKTAARMRLAPASGTVFADIGVRGGSLLGVPLVAAAGCPAGLLVLADPLGLMLADDGIDLDTAGHATLEMSDAPTGTTPKVSLFQRNLMGLRVVRYVNWRVALPGSVATLTGINY